MTQGRGRLAGAHGRDRSADIIVTGAQDMTTAIASTVRTARASTPLHPSTRGLLFSSLALLACSSQPARPPDLKTQPPSDLSTPAPAPVACPACPAAKETICPPDQKPIDAREQLYGYLLAENPALLAFHRKLVSEAPADKMEMMSYFINRYPIIMDGAKGRRMHHHTFDIRDPQKAPLLKQRLVIDNEYADTYRFSFLDLQYFGLGEYDNVRYAWGNLLVGFRVGEIYSYSDRGNYMSKLSLKDRGYLMLVENFKNTFDRSAKNVSRLYEQYKLPFFKLISPALYKSLQIDMTVDTLIVSYEYYQKEDFSTFADLLHEQTYGLTLQDDESATAAHASGNWRWYYGFWDRRKSEGNSDVVIKALREIQAHYPRTIRPKVVRPLPPGMTPRGSKRDRADMPVF